MAFLWRRMTSPLQIPFLAERTDLVALLDEFASRFFDELDYVKECANGVAIREQMQHIKQVICPTMMFVAVVVASHGGGTSLVQLPTVARALPALVSVQSRPIVSYAAAAPVAPNAALIPTTDCTPFLN